MKGILQHLLLTLRLNFRSGQALVYGYLVPLFFLLAFGSVFHSSTPPLLNEMGQLITITVLGGACFGMPTAMVSERERGVWRRYRLLPAATAGLIVSALVARYVIILLAVLMQIGLAWGIYRTPPPAHPLGALAAFTMVCFAFFGMGLMVAMLADAVPAVQALGQAIFLPMIMIGGVGVPLHALPPWAQHLAAYLPGRYAVESLDACIPPHGPGLSGSRFALAALFIIGVAACTTGARLFRWDSGRRGPGGSRAWIGLALAAWLAVGLAAESRGRLAGPIDLPARSAVPQPTPDARPWEKISAADVDGITFENLPRDDGLVTPIANGLDDLPQSSQDRAAALEQKLATWPPGLAADPGRRVRNLLSVASIADILEDPDEGAIGYVVLDNIRANVEEDDLKKVLAWVILHPDAGSVLTGVPELEVSGEVTEGLVRERSATYARKLLMRVLGK